MTKPEKQKGVSLIITFFIMIIILAVVLSVSLLLYGEIKVIRNIGNSMVSLYAADSGIEKVLYYDRQVRVTGQDEDGDILAPRGLCLMPGVEIEELKPGGCSVEICDGCAVFFEDSFDDRTYSVEAKVDEGNSIYSYITSRGAFMGAGRKIEITSSLEQQ